VCWGGRDGAESGAAKDVRAALAGPSQLAARGMAFERLDQIALEYLYGVRG